MIRKGRVTVAALCLWTSAAAAEPAWSPLDVTLGAHAGWLPTNVCRQTASDVVECSPTGFAGLAFGSRYFVSEAWTLGFTGSWSRASADFDDERSFWTASAEGHFYPLAQSDLGLYLAVDAGVVAAVDSLAASELGDATTEVAVAPLLGATLGYDFDLSRRVRLGPSARGLLMAFGNTNDGFEPAPNYPTMGGGQLSLNVSLTPF